MPMKMKNKFALRIRCKKMYRRLHDDKWESLKDKAHHYYFQVEEAITYNHVDHKERLTQWNEHQSLSYYYSISCSVPMFGVLFFIIFSSCE